MAREGRDRVTWFPDAVIPPHLPQHSTNYEGHMTGSCESCDRQDTSDNGLPSLAIWFQCLWCCQLVPLRLLWQKELTCSCYAGVGSYLFME